jgi:hypothetical protein
MGINPSHIDVVWYRDNSYAVYYWNRIVWYRTYSHVEPQRLDCVSASESTQRTC